MSGDHLTPAVPHDRGNRAESQEHHDSAKQGVIDSHAQRSLKGFPHRRVVTFCFVTLAPEAFHNADALQSFFCHDSRISELILNLHTAFVNTLPKGKSTRY